MLEEAIRLIKKQIDMYKIQYSSLQKMTRTKALQTTKKNIEKEIKIREYIIKILKKQ